MSSAHGSVASARRLRRRALVPFRRMSFGYRAGEDLLKSAAFQTYLAAVNVSFSAIEQPSRLAMRVVQLPQLDYVRAKLPKSTIEWPRDAMSLDRGVIVIARSNWFSVETDGAVWAASPGLFFIPPGESHVRFHADAPIDDFVYLSVSSTLLHKIELPKWYEGHQQSLVNLDALNPLLAFLNSLCDASLEDTNQVLPLQRVASEVVKAIVRLITEDASHDMDTFDLAMQILKQEYPKRHLVVPDVARAVNVSERTLHAAFAERNTTVMTELRLMRVSAAREIKSRNPSITRGDLASAAGFGSISSMVRALRDLA